MNNQKIYVVYYAAASAPVQLIRAFQSQRRAAEYTQMLAQAPFPGQDSDGYAYAPIALN